MNPSAQQVIERYIAIDVHKRYIAVGSLNVQVEIVLPHAWRTAKQTRRSVLSGVGGRSPSS